MNIMYRDHSLHAATRQLKKSTYHIQRLETKHLKDLQKMEARVRKRKIVAIFKDTFNVSGHFHDYEFDGLSEE